MSNNEIQNIIVEELKKHSASYIGIFGSFARNEMREDSDIDVLVEFRRKMSLLDFIGVEQDLSEILGKKVDLVMRDAVHPKIWNYIQKDLQILYQ